MRWCGDQTEEDDILFPVEMRMYNYTPGDRTENNCILPQQTIQKARSTFLRMEPRMLKVIVYRVFHAGITGRESNATCVAAPQQDRPRNAAAAARWCHERAVHPPPTGCLW